METQHPPQSTETVRAHPSPAGEEKEVRMWATFVHLSAALGLIGVPFGNVIGPLVIWLLKREEHPFIEQQGREALNFQIYILIYGLGAVIVASIMMMTMILAPLGLLIILGLYVFAIVQIILASIKANSGESYHYPLSIQFIK